MAASSPILEHGFDVVMSARGKAMVAVPNAVFDWLDPPASLGSVTLMDVLAEPDADGAAAVRRWAESVWAAWSPHHAAIRGRTAVLLRAGS